MLSSACSVGIVSSCSWWDSCCEIIGTLSDRKVCGVLSSVCIDPRSVGYICKSSVDTSQADALNSSPAFTSTCVWGNWLRSPDSVLSVAVVLGNDISRLSAAVSLLIVDS